MIIIDTLLQKREHENNPIRVAIVGAGAMSKGLINQITNHKNGMVVLGVYNRTPGKFFEIFKEVGIEAFSEVSSLEEFDKISSEGGVGIARDYQLLLDSPNIDILVDMTGAIEFSAVLALKAFDARKCLLSFNAELDATIGPVLMKRASEAGVNYSIADGDQPGVMMNLYRYVKGLGFEPVLCGNIKGLEDHYRNPTTQKGFAAQWEMSPEMVTSFADGTKMAIEQTCIANATGMKVATRGMYGYYTDKHIDDIKDLYDINQLHELGGIVDYVVGAKPGPGVFIYATAKDQISKKYLRYGKLGDGPLYSFYIPYHLLFFEIPNSIARLVDFDDPTIVSLNEPMVEVATLAKVDLHKGDLLDGLGGYKYYGTAENSTVARNEDLLPAGLAEGCVMLNDVPKDQAIKFSDVKIPEGRLIDQLWKEQF